MGKWKKVRLGDVCLEINYENPSLYDRKIIYIDISSVDSDSKKITSYNIVLSKDAPSRARQRVFEGDVLVSTVRPNLNAVAVIDNKSDALIASTGFCVLRSNVERINNRYLFEFVKSPAFILSITQQATGASYPAVSNKKVLNEKIPLPPLDVQQKIADVLDKASAPIELRKIQLDKLDLLIKSQFIEMFGDLTSNDKGWPFTTLNKICDVRDGTHDSPKYVDKGYPLLTSKNFTNGFVDFSDAYLITETDFNEINKRSKVDCGDIVMPMIGTIGHPIIIDTTQPFAIKNVALIKFEGDPISNVFIKEVLDSDYFKRIVQSKNRGNTQKFIALGDIRNLQVPVVPNYLQEQFATFVSQVDKSKYAIQKSLSKLDLNYKSLMQNYFRGDLF